MLRTTFNSLAEMLEYNQAIMSALEMLYEDQTDQMSGHDGGDRVCDPSFHNAYFSAEFDSFIIPCWLYCEVTYDDSGWADNDPHIPYTVEILLDQVVEYMKENYGYE